MTEGFLLSRVLLRFDQAIEDLLGELSAVTLTPDGSLWVGSDEFTRVERLSPIEPNIFGDHKTFAIGDFVDLFNQEDEIDIEGMDYSDHYLWLTGSHSTKRNKAKGKKPQKDIQRLTEIETDLNRYLLARIPVLQGELLKSISHPEDPDKNLTAAGLEKNETGNLLIEALKQDPHLGSLVTAKIPSKENGLDIEGLAVHGDRVFLGLRGPVLRGWAVILEIEVAETEPGTLTLKEIGAKGLPYRKHFVELNGLGVREICLVDGDLIILAGPTMDLEGAMQIFRLKDVLDLEENSLTSQESGDLEVVFNLNFTLGSDHAEGLALISCLGEPNSLLVVYDSPDQRRLVSKKAVFADVFQLE